MNAADVLEKARDAMSVKRVFGEPYERNGVTLVPVATIAGGGGGGASVGRADGDDRASAESGEGGGFGVAAKPAGVFVITGDDVRWQPAVDVNRIVLGGQIVGIVFLLVLRSILPRASLGPTRRRS